MKKIEYVQRQGDVGIFSIDDFPAGDRVQDALTQNGQLALGELSGHHHAFQDMTDVELFKLDAPEYKGITFIKVKKTTDLIHGFIPGFKGRESDSEYHNTLSIVPGLYITGIFEETDWLTKTVRRVVD